MVDHLLYSYIKHNDLYLLFFSVTVCAKDNDDDDDDEDNVGIIVGGIVGGLAALVIIIGLILYWRKKKMHDYEVMWCDEYVTTIKLDCNICHTFRQRSV